MRRLNHTALEEKSESAAGGCAFALCSLLYGMESSGPECASGRSSVCSCDCRGLCDRGYLGRRNGLPVYLSASGGTGSAAGACIPDIRL